jgi:RNA polymerase-binding protein DksA
MEKDNELTKSEIEEIRKNLISQKDKIMSDLSYVSKEDDHEADNLGAKFPEYGDKPDENAQEISDYSTSVMTEKVLEKTLEDITGALKRIENGTYGICKYCGQPIGKKRLLARPVASSCISCKNELQDKN